MFSKFIVYIQAADVGWVVLGEGGGAQCIVGPLKSCFLILCNTFVHLSDTLIK